MRITLRKKVQKTVAVLLVAVTIFGLADTGKMQTYAYDEKAGMVYLASTSDLLQTYKKADESSDGVSKLVYGKPVMVVGETTGTDKLKWYKITYYIQDGATQKTAYCHASDILLDENAPIIATGKTNASNVSLWSCTGTYQKPELVKMTKGSRLELLDYITDDGEGWYRARYVKSTTTYVGWVKETYVAKDAVPDIETDEAYEAYLIGLGFPESYVHSLAVLHEQYPNWVFEPLKTGLDWTTVIEAESAAGRNLVYKTADDAKKSTASTEYDWTTNTWVIRDSSGWVTAHPDYIAYCMDPRNFLDANNIFMFENLSYSDSHNLEGVLAVIKNTFMATDIANGDGTTLNYANAFMNIGKELAVSPYHLASRVRQEQGAGTSPLISGTYTGYVGYYNYFNIGAYGTPNSVLYANGLSYAKKQGWNTRYKSILGGAKFIAEKYIGVGQDTLYTQKFDVVADGGLYTHQYMTNVEAAISEGNTVAKAYTDKTQAFVFKIPVYTNMPESAVEFTASGNRNNYLKTLKVSGLTLTPTFTGKTKAYSLIVPEDVSSITVSATAVVSTSKVTGTGTYNLEKGTNTIKVKCKSESGSTRTYTLTVVREGEVEDKAYTLTSTKYTIGDYITGVAAGTTAEKFLKKFTCEGGTLKLLTAKNKENTGTVGTGNKLAVYVDGTLVATKEIVIYGDVSGDGKINTLDAIKLNKYTIGLVSLKGSYLEAADASADKKVNTLDSIIINKFSIGLTKIKQSRGE